MSQATEKITPKRCAVYCRVSSDERLDQTFNSIDAQREAGAAFVASQKAEGWSLVPDVYEDPGFSGGNMERPGLKRLLDDIKAGKVDIIVVYKIDRLSRSLADFARMVDLFDKHKVSFSSVTQQINSATSMGRLMLNVLLSFAQFEREVTSERIRDKITASKRKGLWMGGPVPLGYVVLNRKLIIEPKEAETVRWIYDSFLETHSTTHMVKKLADEGIRSKRGALLSKQTIYKILHNRMYLGMLNHKGAHYKGEHPPIVDQSVWDKVQAIMAVDPKKRHRQSHGMASDHLLRGMLYTELGELYLPTTTHKRGGQAYRYYVVNKNHNMGAGMGSTGNLAAGTVETAVMEQVFEVLRTGQMVHRYWQHIRSVNPELSEPEVVVTLFQRTAAVWNQLFPDVKRDIVRSLLKRVTVHPKGITLDWRYEAWGAFIGELTPGTTAREMNEMEFA